MMTVVSVADGADTDGAGDRVEVVSPPAPAGATPAAPAAIMTIDPARSLAVRRKRITAPLIVMSPRISPHQA
jgi:hypothetical protein